MYPRVRCSLTVSIVHDSGMRVKPKIPAAGPIEGKGAAAGAPRPQASRGRLSYSRFPSAKKGLPYHIYITARKRNQQKSSHAQDGQESFLCWCGQQDSNLHGFPPEPKSGVSANSTMPAALNIISRKTGFVNRERLSAGRVFAAFPLRSRHGNAGLRRGKDEKKMLAKWEGL